MPIRNDLSLFGSELKRWRRHRRYSQLELANRASVSQRHLSFLETGRSRPSAEMIEHLSIVLDVPLRARNALFNAAGFADAYSEKPLDGPDLAQVREGLVALVEAHDPFPAYVIDRCWNLLLANTAAATLTSLLLDPEHALALGGNVLRLFLHPDGARSRVPNWAQSAAVLVERFSAERAADPTDTGLAELHDEIMGYPGVAELAPVAVQPTTRFLTEIHIAADGVDLRLYTTIASLAAAWDVTLEELRLETLLPADVETAEALRRLRATT
jgi:transcriptional regulator with XRE-family HTH domain